MLFFSSWSTRRNRPPRSTPISTSRFASLSSLFRLAFISSDSNAAAISSRQRRQKRQWRKRRSKLSVILLRRDAGVAAGSRRRARIASEQARGHVSRRNVRRRPGALFPTYPSFFSNILCLYSFPSFLSPPTTTLSAHPPYASFFCSSFVPKIRAKCEKNGKAWQTSR